VTSGVEDVLALSPLQQGLHSLAGLTDHEDGTDPYVIAMAADVTGTIDVELFRDCAEKMLVRHPNLRSSFVTAGPGKTVAIVPSAVRLPWQHVVAGEAEAAELEADARRRSFDLGAGPAIRFLLVEKPDRAWRLVVVAHHIVIDGWSLPVFVGELIALYCAHGDVTALPPAPRPYRDYIGWLAGRDSETSRTRWRAHLDGLDGPTLLAPALSGREATPGLPDRTEVMLDQQATDAILDAARARGVTVNTLFQMAWAAILSALTDRTDVVYGVTVSGRPDDLSGVESMVGLFINTVPLRVRLDPVATVGRQCLALQREAAELRDHSHLSHAEIRALGGIGEMYDSLLVYENFPPGGLVGSDEFPLTDAVLKPSALESLSHFPVTIAAHPTHGRLTVLVETLDGALGALRAEQLGERVLTVVRRLLDAWDRPLRDVAITIDDEIDAPARFDATQRRGGFHTAFAAVASRTPDAVALSWDGGQLTYAELDSAADRLAATLIERGVQAETPVPIVLRRGPDYVVAMLGVLKAGGVIVPLDPSMPDERIAEITRQTGATWVLDADVVAAASEPPADYRPADVAVGQSAYVVFTSGTTGKPKGVIGTHGALLAYGADHARHVLASGAARLGRPMRIAHAWSFTFDAAWQPLVALLDGHAVHIVGDAVQRDAEALVEEIGRFGVDMIDTTPSMFTQLRAAGLLTEVPLAVLALGGEAIDNAAWQAIQAECARTGMSAHNCYGPTETTVEAVVASIPDFAQPCIGTPTDSTSAHVLDAWLRPVPVGVAGELYLAGGQLTRGYLGRPGETSGRFVASPFEPGERMYRTGDVVRRTADGAIAFLGRSDDQVKIRGFRVEPGEVAAVLHRHPGVRGAHVAVRRHRSGPRLVAYVATDVDVAELRRTLVSTLPKYLVPHHVVAVDDIPLNTNGKVDDKALADLETDCGAADFEGPANETEAILAEVLGEVLGTSREAARIDVTADFLDLGLDSIVALSVVQAVRRRGLSLRARLMLDCTTVRELAAAMDADSDAETVLAEDSIADGEGVPIPLLPNGHWLLAHGESRRLAQSEAIRLPEGVTRARLEDMLRAVVTGHVALRSRLDVEAKALVPIDVETVMARVLREVEVTGDVIAAAAEQTAVSVERLDPRAGVMLDVAWLRPADGTPGILILTPHVLAVDPASWHVVLGELETAWHAVVAGRAPAPVREHTSLRRWSALLADRALKLETGDFWAAQLEGSDPEIGSRRVDPDRDRIADVTISLAVADPDLTARLLSGGVPVTEAIIAATARTMTAWRRKRGQETPVPLLALETLGRADAVVGAGLGDDDVDTGDTVGLLSAIYPMRIAARDAAGVATTLAEMPGDGIDFGLLRHLRADTADRLAAQPGPQILVNYLGRFHLNAPGNAMQSDRDVMAGANRLPEPNLAVRHELTLMAAVLEQDGRPVLGAQWRALPDILSADDLAAMQAIWLDELREVI
jgi:mycobactin peptide synthetase MbtF